MEVSLVKKKECFKRAKKIVEQLLENDVTDSFLLEQVQYITQSDYQDVVDERSIIKMCGYAVCKNKLQNVPNKKFHISTASNKVYDITERKKYCSNQCYKACLYLKEQVLTSPVWLRDMEEMPQFHLLPTYDNVGKVGEEITLDIAKVSIQSETKTVEMGEMDFVSTFALNTLQELEKAGGHCYNSLFIKEETFPLMPNKISSSSNMKKMQLHDSVQSKDLDGKEVLIADKEVIRGDSMTLNEDRVKNLEILETVSNIATNSKKNTSVEAKIQNPESSLKHDKWQPSFELEVDCKKIDKKVDLQALKNAGQQMSLSTKSEKDNIFSKRKLVKSEIVNPNSSKTNKKDAERVEEVSYEWFTIDSAIYLFGIDNVIQKLMQQADTFDNSSQSNDEMQANRTQLLKLCKELEERKNTSGIKEDDAQKTELSALELKVKAFYEGKTRSNPTPNAKEEEKIKPILPDVGKYSLNSARRKIVLTRLSKVLLELFEIFEISTQDVTTEIHALVETFDFGAHNIMLCPNEWNIMGLLIIKMLCERNADLKKLLAKKKSVKRLTMMLESCQLKKDFLDVLINKLCGVDNFIVQHIHPRKRE